VTIVVPEDQAELLAQLPAGQRVSLRTIDTLTDRVVFVIREDDGTLLATVDHDLTAKLAEFWAEKVAEPTAAWVDDVIAELAR
jgi:hypothetical protein